MAGLKRLKFLAIMVILICTGGLLAMWTISGKRLPTVEKVTPVSQEKAVQPPGTSAKEGQSQEEKVPVTVYKAARTKFEDTLPVMGTIKGSAELNLKFEVSGVIDSFNFREGDMLKKGDLIASLAQKDALLKIQYSESKIKTAEVNYSATQKKLQMHQHLYEIGAIIEPKLDEAKLEAEAARLEVETIKVELESIRSELEKTRLYASRDGVIGSRKAEVGEFVTPNDKVASIMEIKEVFVELGIVERDIERVKLGQEVKVNVDAYPEEKFLGKVDLISPSIEGKSRTLTIKVKLPNPNNLLLPGMFARTTITTAKFENVFVVPALSVQKSNEVYNIFLVEDEKSARLKEVKINYITNDYAIITEGLEEGNFVIVDTPVELKEGTPVEIIEVQEAVS